MPAAVDPTKADRRKLRFHSIEDVLVEVDRIVAAEKAGTLRRMGNWTTGQTFGHLAAWINYGWEGYPFTVPWFIRPLIRWKLKSILRDGMPSGVRIPRVAGGTYGTDALSIEEGEAKLRAALHRLDSGEPPRFVSPALGKLSQEDRVRLNLRHAELHLGYLHPE